MVWLLLVCVLVAVLAPLLVVFTRLTRLPTAAPARRRDGRERKR